MKRKLKITIKTEELTVFKTRQSLICFGEHCGESVELLTTEKAAALSGLPESQIFRLMESGKIHFIQAEKVLVCQNSLKNWAETKRSEGENFN